jgi:acetyltransferase
MPNLTKHSGTLSEYEAKQVLANAGIPTVREQQATRMEDAVQYADQLGYPAILKVDSADIQHKSDIGAVKDVHNADEARKRYQIIHDNVAEHRPEADVNSILVEEHVSGTELIVGVKKDADFGHVIMFGIGGIFVEVLEDVTFRSLPITEHDAMDMLHDLRAAELLDGVRGNPPVDKAALIDVLLHVSDLIDEHPEIAELDINPLFADENGVTAADAVITVSDT